MTDGKSLRGLFEALLVLMIISLLAFHFTDAATNFSLTKPLISEFVATPNPLKTEIVNLTGGYNVNMSRYDNATVVIRNTVAEEASGTVTVQLLNATNSIIAYGDEEFALLPIAQHTTYINVALTWQGNATIADYAKGRVTIS
ncbi:MAG: hypothetical protein HWN68_07715 [Desulfobacterales bacterium]|nr:hypothetical protein [Desulfobacterales bacterium]